MGTALTGLEIKDTYDGLVKITDNGPLSATAKYLSDGLGNDSVLALSNARVGVGTNAPSVLLDIVGNSAAVRVAEAGGAEARIVSGGSSSFVGTYSNHPLIILTNSAEKVRFDAAGNVGIGNTAPSDYTSVGASNLVIGAASGSNGITITSSTTGFGNLAFADGTAALDQYGGLIQYGHTDNTMNFFVTATERFRITANGVTFNGDTAAANALDDYEEGTWTMGITFDGAAVGVTTSQNTGTYTKIGRQVTVNGRLILTNKGSSTGVAEITGLPFTIPNTFSNQCAAALWFANISFTNQFQAIGSINTTTIILQEITNAGSTSSLTDADFANNSNVTLSFTYFV
jgi:hypothetical protein